MLFLPPRLEGLGIKIFTVVASVEFENSKQFTKRLHRKISPKGKQTKTERHTTNQKRVLGAEQRGAVGASGQHVISDKRRTKDCNRETCIKLVDKSAHHLGYDLNKERFWDAIRIHRTLPRLPTNYVCEVKS